MDYKNIFSPETLAKLNKKSADNLIEGIEKAKNISLPRFIFSLSILHVGEETAECVAGKFNTLEKYWSIEKNPFI